MAIKRAYKVYVYETREKRLVNQHGELLKQEEWEEIKANMDNFYSETRIEAIESFNKKVRQTDQTIPQAVNTERVKVGFVYFVKAIDSGFVKVGMTSNIKSRMKSLQSASPHKLKLIGYISSKDYADIELTAHDYFRKKLIIGEWYEINQDHIDGFCNKFGHDYKRIL